ncbi:MAG: hypothetical protein EHM39_02550 [Chloroflexi bacterium]|nr:MAG: hypothetical protein EHM39_02550 [Chloroflexota bacterium]
MQYKYSANPNSSMPPYAVLLNSGQVYFQFFNGGSWYAAQKEPPNLVDVVIAANQICGLDNQGFVYYYRNVMPAPVWDKDPVASLGVSLSSHDNGLLFCTNQHGEVWARWLYAASSTWNKIPITLTPPPTWNYTVKQGEHLLMIVRREYSTGTNDALAWAIAEQVKVLNPAHGNWDLLKVGEVLVMPAKS